MLQTLRDKTSGWIATVILGAAGDAVRLLRHGAVPVPAQRRRSPPRSRPRRSGGRTRPAFWPVTMLWQRDEIERRGLPHRIRARAPAAARSSRASSSIRVRSRRVDNKRKVLDTLVDQRVLKMTADRAGIAVGDAQVRETIQGIPAFQVDGKFDPQRYQLALASQVPARTPRQFEAGRARQPAAVPDPDRGVASRHSQRRPKLDRLLKLLGEKRDVTLRDPAAAGAGRRADHAPRRSSTGTTRHAADYRAPETVSLEYVDIDGSDAAGAGRRPMTRRCASATSRRRAGSSSPSSAWPRTSSSRSIRRRARRRRRPPRTRRRSSPQQAQAAGRRFRRAGARQFRRHRLEGGGRRPGLGGEGRDGQAVRGRACSRCRPARSRAR